MYRFSLLLMLTAIISVDAVAQTRGEGDLSPSAGRDHGGEAIDDQNDNHRQREGSRLANQRGYFRGSGDGLTFHFQDSDEKYPALENLALERIGKVMSDRHDHPDQVHWSVSGFFTEYRGSNYLFITHAVLESKTRRRSALP